MASGRVVEAALVTGYDPGDVLFAAPASYYSEVEKGYSPRVLLTGYFHPRPGYWSAADGDRRWRRLVIVGRLSCLMTRTAVVRLADRADALALYTNHYCYQRINGIVAGAINGAFPGRVSVKPLERKERFQVDRSLMKYAWIVFRYFASLDDPERNAMVVQTIVELADRWRDSRVSEEVDYGSVVEEYARRIVREYRDEVEGALTEYMDNAMRLVAEGDHVKVFEIEVGGRQLSNAAVVARLHAESVGKVVVALRYTTNLHYMVLAVPDESMITASALAKVLDQSGPIRRRIYDAGKRIFEGLVVFRQRQGKVVRAIVDLVDSAFAKA